MPQKWTTILLQRSTYGTGFVELSGTAVVFNLHKIVSQSFKEPSGTELNSRIENGVDHVQHAIRDEIVRVDNACTVHEDGFAFNIDRHERTKQRR